MAWTYGNKKWTVPFLSLNGTSCRVDIYQRGYTGSTVTTLIGAADPFEYEEDNDEDLLSHVIRFRTGYLRVVEESYGALSDLYPTLNTDRYIEFYYGETLDFNGFIQAQEFENPWEPGPRVVELPVISPLGLASGTDISWSSYNPPRWVKVETLINNMLAALEGMYDGYYFPKILSIDNALTDNIYVNSLTFCPFGSDYNKNADVATIYAPKTVEYALTCVCTWLGLILHDVPGRVIFQRVDYNDDYLRRRDTSNPYYTPAIIDMTTVATIASNQNVKSKVMPLSKIDVQYAGDLDVPNMNFSRCRGYSRGCAVEGAEFCTNQPMIDDFTGNYDINVSINSDGFISKGVICLGAYGKGGLQEMIMYRPNDWGSGVKVATYTFFEWNGTSAMLSFSFKYGEGYEDLGTPEDMPVAVVIKCGVYYWNSQASAWQVWSVNSGYSANWRVKRGSEGLCEVGILYNPYLTQGYPLTVEFYAPQSRDDYVYAISNVGLKKSNSASGAYLNPNMEAIGYTIKGNPSIVDGFIERGYSHLIYTLNRIQLNNSIISTGALENQLNDAEPQYPYLLEAQDRLQIDIKMTTPQDNASLYLDRLSLWGTAGYWRTIAYGFRPWNDTYRLTLHHSSVFDT